MNNFNFYDHDEPSSLAEYEALLQEALRELENIKTTKYDETGIYLSGFDSQCFDQSAPLR